MAINKKEVVSFAATVSAGGSLKLHERIKAQGVITRLSVRFYSGQERALRVTPYVIHKGNKPEDVVTYVEGSSPYLAGDDDNLDFSVAVPVEYDDELYVNAVNTSGFNYDLVVYVSIEYFGEGS